MTAARLIIVGLGPGDERYVTAHTLDLIARTPRRIARTRQHPSAHLLGDAPSFDHLYDHSASFEEVYARIVEELLAASTDAAAAGEDLVYAVPGSPLVLERTVAALRAHPGLDCEIQPAMSFLDLLYARLGIDPVEAGVTLVDGHRFSEAAAGITGPMVVAHAHADWVLSEIKLAVEEAEGTEEVVICQGLGTPDERLIPTTWADLDRTVHADHLTSLWIPQLRAPVGGAYVRFHQLARTLRERCPWDTEQTHRSLIPHLIEETYEVVDAIGGLDPENPHTDEHLIEELGDLLYHIEFHATIAEQEGRFTIVDVANGIHDKLVRRHPHVFRPADGPGALVDGAAVDAAAAGDAAAVVANWEEIKRAEKGRTSVFDGIPAGLPALAFARKIQSKAAKMGFDWPDRSGPVAKIAEETTEVLAAADSGDAAATEDELGDLLFSVVNLARHLDVDPEVALRSAALRFRTRAATVERLAAAGGLDVSTASLETLDELWEQAKRTPAPPPAEG